MGETHRELSAFLRGAAIGAAVMYLFDPDKGRRRRAIARDRAMRFVGDAGDVMSAAARDVGNRLRGAQAMAARSLRHAPTPDDLKLIERVRARIGRVVSNPHAIQVGALGGRVVLSGPVLAGEADALVEAARAVPGVVGLEDHLDMHDVPGSVPSLQGSQRRGLVAAPRGLEPAAPVARAAGIVAGTWLALYGATRASLPGMALAGLGASLAMRSAQRAAPHEQREPLHAESPAREQSAAIETAGQ